MAILETLVKKYGVIRVGSFALMIAGLVFYITGFTQLLFVSVILFISSTFHFPKIASSFFSKIVLSTMVFFSLLQIVSALQFFLLPNSQFTSAAILVTASAIVVAFFTRNTKPIKTTLFTKTDLFASVTSLFFIVPVLVFCLGENSAFRIGSLGGIQGADGVNHSVAIADISSDERLTYSKGDYYPMGFHLVTAFIQDSYSIEQGEHSWLNGAKLYIGQYVIFAFILSFTLFLLAKQIVAFSKNARISELVLAVSLGSGFSLFYLFPFLYNGFLSYLYIFSAITVGLLYLAEYFIKKNNSRNGGAFGLESGNVWTAASYLLLVFGASFSWPLLGPPLVLGALLAIMPTRLNDLLKVKTYANRNFITIAVAFLIQLIPIYIQYTYSATDSAQEINAVGALKVANCGIIAASLVLGVGLVFYSGISRALKDFLNSTLLPMYGFVGSLVLYQYFTVGELRYYVIKIAIWLELFTFLLVASLIVKEYSKLKHNKFPYALMAMLAPTIIFMTLIGLNGNPVQGLRSLFRTYSGEQKPQHFDQDVLKYSRLGEANNIDMFNSTLLHYDYIAQKFYAHMQISFWANEMQYNAVAPEIEAKNCSSSLYKNLLFGTFTDKEQAELIETVNRCAKIASNNKRKYYVVTDDASVSFVREKLVGDNIVIVSK